MTTRRPLAYLGTGKVGELPTGDTLGADRVSWAFSIPGSLALTAGDGSEDVPMINGTGGNLSITNVAAAVGQAPSGAAVILDVLVNGTSIFTSSGHRVTIAAGSQTSTTTIDTPSWPSNGLLVVRVAQVGSSTPGARMAGHVLAVPA